MSQLHRYGLAAAILVAGIATSFQYRNNNAHGSMTIGWKTSPFPIPRVADLVPTDNNETASAFQDVTSIADESAPVESQDNAVNVSGSVPQPPDVLVSQRLTSPTRNLSGSYLDTLETQITNEPTASSRAAAEEIAKCVEPNPQQRQNTPPQDYIVKLGDSLGSIAHNQLGNAKRYTEIYALNRDRLRSPNDLYAGMVIRLPSTNGTYVNGSLAHQAPPPQPNIQLQYAPAGVATNSEIIPARQSRMMGDVSNADRNDGTVPARQSPYLPRAFRRQIDSPSADALYQHFD